MMTEDCLCCSYSVDQYYRDALASERGRNRGHSRRRLLRIPKQPVLSVLPALFWKLGCRWSGGLEYLTHILSRCTGCALVPSLIYRHDYQFYPKELTSLLQKERNWYERKVSAMHQLYIQSSALQSLSFSWVKLSVLSSISPPPPSLALVCVDPAA